MRKMKNEFMANWDGLKSKERVRVLVLAATNRPMDLDDAVIRRLPRRLMVDLPDTENRLKILRVRFGMGVAVLLVMIVGLSWCSCICGPTTSM